MSINVELAKEQTMNVRQDRSPELSGPRERTGLPSGNGSGKKTQNNCRSTAVRRERSDRIKPNRAELIRLADYCDREAVEMKKLYLAARRNPIDGEYADVLTSCMVPSDIVLHAAEEASRIGVYDVADRLTPPPLFSGNHAPIISMEDAVELLQEARDACRESAKWAEKPRGNTALANALLKVFQAHAPGTPFTAKDLRAELDSPFREDLGEDCAVDDHGWRAKISKAIDILGKEHDIVRRPYRYRGQRSKA